MSPRIHFVWLTRWPDRLLNWSHNFVWPRGLVLVRSLVATGTAVTLAATPINTLFYRSKNFPNGIICSDGMVNTISLFCRLDSSYLVLGKLAVIAVLLVAISGYSPRIMGILHWYVTFSFVSTSPVPDGGDHLALVIATLILPVSLVDSRRWAWGDDPPSSSSWWIVASFTQLAGLIQTLFVYFHSSIAKFGVEEWADGTALWYWSRQNVFGFPGYLREITDKIFSLGWVVGSFTYGVLVLEFYLGLSVFMRWQWKAVAFVLGILFHLIIALTLGLISFAFSAWGLLVLAFGYAFRQSLMYRVASSYKD